MTVVANNRIPTQLRRAARIAAGPALLTAAVIAAGWIGYLLLDNAARPLTLGAFLLFAAACVADSVITHLRIRGIDDRAQRAEDTADRALGTVQTPRPSPRPRTATDTREAARVLIEHATGRHAAKESE